MDLIRSSRCVCGNIYQDDWCPQCLSRFGDHRRPPMELDAKQRMEELVLMVRPVAIPVSFRWRRYQELAAALMPSQPPSFDDFLNMEGSVETALAKKRGRTPMFEWPPARAAQEERRRQRAITQVLGMPAVKKDETK